MEFAGVISAAISAAGTIGVAIIGVHQAREKKANDLRQEGALIQMEMAQASLKLSLVTAKAVTNQKVNGDVEEAMSWAKAVEIKYNQYLRRISQAV